MTSNKSPCKRLWLKIKIVLEGHQLWFPDSFSLYCLSGSSVAAFIWFITLQQCALVFIFSLVCVKQALSRWCDRNSLPREHFYKSRNHGIGLVHVHTIGNSTELCPENGSNSLGFSHCSGMFSFFLLHGFWQQKHPNSAWLSVPTREALKLRQHIGESL